MISKRYQLMVSLLMVTFLLNAAVSLQDNQNARVKFLIGEAEILSRNQTNWRLVKLNMEVMSGDRIRTALNARVELEMPDGSVINVNENTVFDVKEIKTTARDQEDKMNFTLWAGNIWANFKKAINVRQIRQIESPVAVVAIRGTTLEMDVDQEQTTVVRVLEGSVSVTSIEVEGEVIVASNQETIVRRGRAPLTPQRFTPRDAPESQSGQAFLLQINTSQLQFTDPAVLLAGVPVNGRVVPGATVSANGIPLQVDASGNFFGRVNVQEGLNDITVEAQSGELRRSSNLRIFVNTKGPEIRLSKPIVAGFLNRRDYSLSGAVFDPTPRDKVKVYLNGEMVAEVFGRGSFNRTIILNEGKNELRIYAEDLSGNRAEIADQLFLDTVKPIITVTEPAQQVYTRFEPPRPPAGDLTTVAPRYSQIVRGLVIDPEPSSQLKRVTVNGKEIKPNPDGTFETEIILERGENRLSFYAEDLAGNITRDNSRVIWVR